MSIEQELSGLRRDPPAGHDEAVMLGTGLADGFSTYESPIGAVVVTFNPAGVSSVDLATEGFAERFIERFGRRSIEAAAPRAWRGGIERALENGTPGKLPVDFRSVSGFQKSVLEQAAAIPRGEVRPYSWLATQVGKPGATRAVGTTMARNPVPLIVPCHRVVRADGRIGAYSLGGAQNKLALLAVEGADPERLEALAGRGVRFLGSGTTRIFCHPSCRHARRIGDSHLIEFRSTRDAQNAGFRPCSVCEPETS
ncbi:MAG: methylated-DNA--[protein]-cysteine S-methyltransferase [Acidimicrobiia bacterium]|nr:methylated-DNA--[protein]-cysteine S-methyltransferase [Acidimicrobiia bacterium]